MRLVVRQQFGRSAAAEFLEFFCEFPRDAELSIGHDVDANLERFGPKVARN